MFFDEADAPECFTYPREIIKSEMYIKEASDEKTTSNSGRPFNLYK